MSPQSRQTDLPVFVIEENHGAIVAASCDMSSGRQGLVCIENPY
jgi:hypothetical protein